MRPKHLKQCVLRGLTSKPSLNGTLGWIRENEKHGGGGWLEKDGTSTFADPDDVKMENGSFSKIREDGRVVFHPWSSPKDWAKQKKLAVKPENVIGAEHEVYAMIELRKQNSDESGFSLALEGEAQIRSTWYGGTPKPRLQQHDCLFSLEKAHAVVAEMRSSGKHVLFPPTGYTPSTQRSCVEECAAARQGKEVWSISSIQRLDDALQETGILYFNSTLTNSMTIQLDRIR